MAIHSKRDVEGLERRLAERYEALMKVMQGVKELPKSATLGETPGRLIRAEDIRFAVDDVATALKKIKARLGKG